jgi:hypothetical protein
VGPVSLRVIAEIAVGSGRGFSARDPEEFVRAAPGRMESYRRERPLFAVSQEALREFAELSPGDAARENAQRLIAGEAVSVTSGQQPGYCGGPYLLLLKIATSIALARRLAKRGVPAVPVFWSAADDTDFDEISAAYLGTGRLALLKRVLDASIRSPGLVVGAVPTASAAPGLAAFFRGPGQEGIGLGEFGRGFDYLDALWQECAARAGDLGSLNGRFLGQLFAEHGLVVVDARSSILREAARPLYGRYLERHGAVGASLLARGAEIAASGGGRALDDGALEWCLFRREGETRTRIDAADRVEEARRLLGQRPPAVSPNVALRPIVEDFLFPHVARVVGPSEMLYHDEILPAYELLGAERALPVARLAMTHLPRETEMITRREAGAAAALWEDFDGLVRRAAARESAQLEAGAALHVLRADWERGLAELRASLGEAGAGLIAELERSARKVGYELTHLEEAVDGLNRRALYRREPRLRELKNYLFPRGEAQERRLSLSSLVSLWGEETPRLLLGLAEQHLDRLSGGAWVHLGVADDQA